MDKPMRFAADLGLVLFVVFLFLLVISDLATRGMSLDGTLYAAIANSLASGDGSFWFPASFVSGLPFHDHPPLGLYAQSLLFTLVGDYFWTENLFAGLTLIAAIVLMVSIGRVVQVEGTRSVSWMSVLFFCICPLAAWSYTNNYLENLLTVVGLLAVLFALKGLSDSKEHNSTGESAHYVFCGLSGLMVFIGMLIKGPVALWPLAFYPLYWIAFRGSYSNLGKRFLIQLSSLALLLVLVFQYEPAAISAKLYLDQQLQGTFSGARTVDFGRTLVLTVLGKNLAGPILYSIVLLACLRTKPQLNRWGMLFLLLGLSASLPLMLSPRQYEHYLLPSLPLYAIALGICMQGVTARFVEYLSTHLKALYAITLLMAMCTFYVYIEKYGTVSDDEELIVFVEKSRSYLAPGDKVQLCHDFQHARARAYFYRHLGVKSAVNAEVELCHDGREASSDQLLLSHDSYRLYATKPKS